MIRSFIELDDATNNRLLQIAQRHCKLVLEHFSDNVPSERREAIRAEIVRLRGGRDALMSMQGDSR